MHLNQNNANIRANMVAWLNETGNRQQLEDAIFPLSGQAKETDKLFIVCDGIGGEHRGEAASRITTEAFAAYFQGSPPAAGVVTPAYLDDAKSKVLTRFRHFVMAHPEAARMGTTLTLAYLGVGGVYVAWCGDSRVYHIRDGKILWRSADHSIVGDLMRAGKLTDEEARFHPHKNILMRAISLTDSSSDIDLHHLHDIQSGDHLLLCTDGILENIDDKLLETIFSIDNISKRDMILEKCRDKTNDNYSMYLVKLEVD